MTSEVLSWFMTLLNHLTVFFLNENDCYPNHGL